MTAMEDFFMTSLDMLEKSDSKDSPMLNFYKDKTVFLTGCTGFLGKLMIEKLLRCNVKEIYVLARSKKGKTAVDRVNEIFSEPIFVLLNKKKEMYQKRLTVVEGDLQLPGLGLCQIARQKIIDNVEIVFHAAADVRFDENLKESVEINVRATRDILFIAKEMRFLESFLYVSTAYANCIRHNVDEKFYRNLMDPDFMIKVIENLKEEDFENFQIMSSLIIKPFPNTYTFSKALAEQVVQRYGDGLPIAVIRPSIITTTYQDPIQGWTDNLYGLNGVVIGAGVGVLRILHIDNRKNADIVPADVVVNSALAVAWWTNSQFSKSTDLPKKKFNDYYYNYENESIQVYNCSVTEDNPITWGRVKKLSVSYGNLYPVHRAIWIVRYNTTKYYYVSQFLKIFYHFIPALIVDTYLKVNGKKPKLLKLYRKVNKFAEVLNFFTTQDWKFHNKNMRKIYHEMSPYDKEFFPCDIRDIHWDDFFGVYVKGLRQYITKETLENLQEARMRNRKIKIIHYVMMALLYSLIAYICFSIFNVSEIAGYYLDMIKIFFFPIYAGLIKPVIEIFTN